jgi:antitoxin component YwqK of YwqJK toxin-antitoxin module
MKTFLRHHGRWIVCVALALSLCVAVVVWIKSWSIPAGVHLVSRSALELRDGVLYARGEAQPFRGQIVEHYPDRTRKLALEVKDGRLNGHSLGWHQNGQMEVNEEFVQGVSHGPRTRWYANGQMKSQAQVEHGTMTGLYVEWHENGQKAAEMTLRDGQPDGVVQAWHASGLPKSRSELRDGEMVGREFFPDAQVSVTQATPAPPDAEEPVAQ